MRKFAPAALLLTAISTPAFAGNAIVEAQLGYDAPSAGGGSVSGLSYGATLGYELPIDDTIFFGAEVSVNDSTAKDCQGSRTIADPRLCASFGRDFGAGIRFGADISEKSTLYAVVGYSNTKLTVSADDGTGKIGASANAEGIQLGAGFRHYFAGKAYGKIEYRYTNYESGIERHQGLVGVGYQF